MKITSKYFKVAAGLSFLLAIIGLAHQTLFSQEWRKQKACKEWNRAYKPTTDVQHFDQITLDSPGICRAYACPQYKIVIHGDGRVDYHGSGGVKLKGSSHGTLSQQQLSKVIAALNASAYLSIPDRPSLLERMSFVDPWECPGHILANNAPKPTAVTALSSVTLDGELHKITLQPPMPKQITKFEKEVEEIINAEQWIGTEKERRKLEIDYLDTFK